MRNLLRNTAVFNTAASSQVVARRRTLNIVYLVVPCYNEQEVIDETSRRLVAKLTTLIQADRISADSRIIFVDDGSRDLTWRKITELCIAEPLVTGLRLSRNRGHQNALLAGLFTASESADAIISLDADLQDDIDTIDSFLEKYEEGYDIVYGVRSSRRKDSWFKRNTAQLVYKVMHILGAEVEYNHADYRLMSRRAVEALKEFGEVNLFLRGIVPLIGFPSARVLYERGERFAGESKYPLRKMISFALEGILSFSIKPIKMIMSLGLLVSAISIAMLLYFLIGYFVGHTVPGWTSTIVSIWAIGGLQLLSVGVIGEYIGKIYLETKHRPKFIIDEFIRHETASKDR